MNSAVFGLASLDTSDSATIRSPNHIIVEVSGLVVDSIDDILSDSANGMIHVYPEAYWGFRAS